MKRFGSWHRPLDGDFALPHGLRPVERLALQGLPLDLRLVMSAAFCLVHSTGNYVIDPSVGTALSQVMRHLAGQAYVVATEKVLRRGGFRKSAANMSFWGRRCPVAQDDGSVCSPMLGGLAR